MVATVTTSTARRWRIGCFSSTQHRFSEPPGNASSLPGSTICHIAKSTFSQGFGKSVSNKYYLFQGHSLHAADQGSGGNRSSSRHLSNRIDPYTITDPDEHPVLVRPLPRDDEVLWIFPAIESTARSSAPRAPRCTAAAMTMALRSLSRRPRRMFPPRANSRATSGRMTRRLKQTPAPWCATSISCVSAHRWRWSARIAAAFR